MTDKVITAINESELWKRLNREAKALYEAHNRVPSQEEYQALRNIIMCKVMLEDPTVKDLMCTEVWNELQKAHQQ